MGLLTLKMLRVFLFLGFGLSGLYAQHCLPVPVLPVASVSDTLGSANCTLSDGTPPYSSYRLVLPVRGRAQIQLNPNPGSLAVALQDGTGAQIASGSSIQRSLEAGTYTILVNLPAMPASGSAPLPISFTLQTSLTAEPGMLRTGFPTVGIGQTVAGVVGGSGCTTPDGTLYEAYLLNTFGAGTLNVTVSGQGFTPLLIVQGEDGSLLGSDPASVTVPVDAGSQYQVMVATSDTTGAYQVATTFTPATTETCLPQNSQPAPMTDNNSITSTSCSQVIDQMGDLAYYNYYKITVPAAGQIDISAASSDFSPTLDLLDANGNTVAVDSGGGVMGTNGPGSEIRLQVPAGSYIVEVFSNYTSGGNYKMSYNFAPGPPQPCATGSLTPGTPAAGTLSASSCRTQLGLSDLYTLTLPLGRPASTLDSLQYDQLHRLE